MVSKEDIEFWSKQYGRPVTEAEVEEIKFNLKAFGEWLIEAYTDLRKRGIMDEKGDFIRQKKVP